MVPHVTEFHHHLLLQLVIYDRDGEWGGFIGQEVPIVGALEVQFQVCKRKNNFTLQGLWWVCLFGGVFLSILREAVALGILLAERSSKQCPYVDSHTCICPQFYHGQSKQRKRSVFQHTSLVRGNLDTACVAEHIPLPAAHCA